MTVSVAVLCAGYESRKWPPDAWSNWETVERNWTVSSQNQQGRHRLVGELNLILHIPLMPSVAICIQL